MFQVFANQIIYISSYIPNNYTEFVSFIFWKIVINCCILATIDDYTPGPYYANFAANTTTSDEVCISITKDNELECEETFTVCIANETTCSCSKDENANRTIRIKDQCKVLYIVYNEIEFSVLNCVNPYKSIVCEIVYFKKQIDVITLYIMYTEETYK